jgi:hypothetical protein
VVRKLNRAAELRCALAGFAGEPPASGARVRLLRESGAAVFTGYLPANATRQHLGWGEQGAVYRDTMHAVSDEWLLDQAVLPKRPVFALRTAGEIARQITESAGAIDVGGVAEGDPIVQFPTSLQRWSDCMQSVAQQSRMSYRLLDGKLSLRPVGEVAWGLSEADDSFSPDRLTLAGGGEVIASVIALGRGEPDAFVKDYFLGDGYSLRNYLSATPFGQNTSTILEQEYDLALDPKYWSATGAATVDSGRLWVQGAGTVEFAEVLQVGGALTLQHGDVQFQSASSGTMGALKGGASVLAGFAIAKSGVHSTITAVINGVTQGNSMTAAAGHHYVLSTRVYATETVRVGERYHAVDETRGGEERAADARVVLEVHDIDPNQAQSQVAPATVLYDGAVAAVPATCRYVLADGIDLHCSVAYTRILRMPNVLVRSSLPGQDYRTRLVGAMVDGAECRVSNGDLQFFTSRVPASNEKIVAEYRSAKKSFGQAGGEGRSIAWTMVSPIARTSEDCASAAQALLANGAVPAWSGEYVAWSDFLPDGADDIWPGDRLDLSLPSRDCRGPVIVREVAISVDDPENDRGRYAVTFANEAAAPIALTAAPATANAVAAATARDPERFVLANLPQAQVTEVTSTSVTIDAGADPIAGGGFEVRRTDSGWDPLVDRNLVGRFQTRVITVTRLSRVQTWCIRQYDASSPVKYSRCATQLHVDYPL